MGLGLNLAACTCERIVWVCDEDVFGNFGNHFPNHVCSFVDAPHHCIGQQNDSWLAGRVVGNFPQSSVLRRIRSTQERGSSIKNVAHMKGGLCHMNQQDKEQAMHVVTFITHFHH